MKLKNKSVIFPLIGINLVMFFLQVMLGEGFTKALMLTPNNIITQPWILITSMFLHGGVGHLFFNMYALMIFGPLIEKMITPKRFLYLYFGSGLIAGIGYSLFSINPALGASGAIMGVLGMTIILLPNLKVLFLFFIPMSMRTAGIIFALIDLFGVFNPSSGIAHVAHLFGLTIGLIYGWYLLKERKHFRQAFNILKKYTGENTKSQKNKRNKSQVRNADFSYSEKIQLTDNEIDNYLKNGRL